MTQITFPDLSLSFDTKDTLDIFQAEMIYACEPLYFHPTDQGLFAQLSRLDTETYNRASQVLLENFRTTQGYLSSCGPVYENDHVFENTKTSIGLKAGDFSWASLEPSMWPVIDEFEGLVNMGNLHKSYACFEDQGLSKLGRFNPTIDLSSYHYDGKWGDTPYTHLIKMYIDAHYTFLDKHDFFLNFVAGVFRVRGFTDSNHACLAKSEQFLQDSGWKNLFSVNPSFLKKAYLWSWQDTERLFMLVKVAEKLSHRIIQLETDLGEPLSVYKHGYYTKTGELGYTLVEYGEVDYKDVVMHRDLAVGDIIA